MMSHTEYPLRGRRQRFQPAFGAMAPLGGAPDLANNNDRLWCARLPFFLAAASYCKLLKVII